MMTNDELSALSSRLVELVEGNRKVEIQWIGEGTQGDYDPSDSDDCPLLHFTVLDLVEGEWVQVDNASYCTAMDARLPESAWEKAAEHILAHIGDADHIKGICEKLLWMDGSAFVESAAPTP